MIAGSADLEHRRLGCSDVIVPRVALGCAPIGAGEPDPFARMDAAWELGITHFDTCDGFGEHMIGLWIESRGVRPLLTTTTGDGGLAPERVEHHLQLSLERLGVDHVDLYLAGDFDPDVPLTDSLAAFDASLGAGAIRAYGVSQFTAAQLQDALDAGHPQAIENAHSLLARDDERYVLPLCAERDIAYIASRPLDGVSGAVGELQVVADGCGQSIAAVALAWLLADERVTQIVVGPEHLDDVADAVTMSLGAAELLRLCGALGRASGSG